MIWIGWREGPIRATLFSALDPRTLAVDLALGLAVGGALVAAWRGVGAHPLARELEARLAHAIGPLTSAEIAALAILSGFAEELFFRGAMQRAWGFLPATLAFALLHSGRGRAFRLWTGYALIAGLAFGSLVAWRGTLAPAIVAHALVNAVNLRRLSAAHFGDSR